MDSLSGAFQAYAWFSVQVDQYYAAIRIFAYHYDKLKSIYQLLPREREDRDLDLSHLTEGVRQFLGQAQFVLSYMGTTQIFADAPFDKLKSLPTDIINFGFYTCYCFQWTLFENFVKETVLALADDGTLPTNVGVELQKRGSRTAQFLRYIDSGAVFGNTPFVTVLAGTGWSPENETCSLVDLDAIREQRNRFIHSVGDPTILPNSESDKERLYSRAMWILRDFARNVDLDAQRLRRKTSP